MTVRERKYIEALAEKYEHWRQQEEAAGRRATEPEEKDEHYDQAKLHGSAADALNNLLIRLENKDYQV